jgi:hypothetical protein
MSTALAVAGLCSCAARPEPEGAAPWLVVVIVVDQMRADSLTGAQGPSEALDGEPLAEAMAERVSR